MALSAADDRVEEVTRLVADDGTEEAADTQPGPPAGEGATARWLVPLLVVAMLASAAWLAVTVAGRQGEQDAVQADRETVMAQAEAFMTRVNTYGPDELDADKKMPGYRERVKALVTPKLGASFDEQVAVAEQLVANAGERRTAEVFSAGVSAIDADSATALVAGVLTSRYADGKPQPRPFRVEIELVKIDGTWLVDDYAPVTGGTDE